MKLYISGGMTGYPDFNYPRFNEVEKQLQESGYETVNPVNIAPYSEEKTWSDYLRIDIRELMDVDGIVALEGWEESKGATVEIYLGIVLGMPIYNVNMEKIDVNVKIDKNILLSFLNC